MISARKRTASDCQTAQNRAEWSELEVALSDCVIQAGQAQLDTVERIVEGDTVVSGGPAIAQLPIGRLHCLHHGFVGRETEERRSHLREAAGDRTWKTMIEQEEADNIRTPDWSM